MPARGTAHAGLRGLPSAPGTYALWLRLAHRATVTVGRLGTFAFPPGEYLYIGSALGPGGLAARVAHHARHSPSPHWHIDYLRRHAELVAVWHRTGRVHREHDWAAALMQWPGATVPVAGFGASDCRCPAHLVRLTSPPRIARFRRLVDEAGMLYIPASRRGRRGTMRLP
jgi:Uri superfamily endonuclease